MIAKRKQIGGNWSARLGVLGYTFPASPATANVTTAISTTLSTAGELEGVAVALPVTPSTGVTVPGVITTGTNNYVQLRNSTTKGPLDDGTGVEVYGRITEAASLYTLSLYTLVAGVETAYAPVSPVDVDFYFPYRIPFNRLPTDINISTSAQFVKDDPSASFSSQVLVSELLTITVTDTLPNLTFVPDDPANVQLVINTLSEDNFGGGSASYSVSGVVLTWSAANAGYPLVPGDKVVARYTTTV